MFTLWNVTKKVCVFIKNQIIGFNRCHFELAVSVSFLLSVSTTVSAEKCGILPSSLLLQEWILNPWKWVRYLFSLFLHVLKKPVANKRVKKVNQCCVASEKLLLASELAYKMISSLQNSIDKYLYDQSFQAVFRLNVPSVIECDRKPL